MACYSMCGWIWRVVLLGFELMMVLVNVYRSLNSHNPSKVLRYPES
jgi:hypothetical protein